MRITVAFLVVAAFALVHETSAQPPKPAAKDTARLELVDVPAGAAVSLNGKDVGKERRFTVTFPAGETGRVTLDVRFANGGTLERRLLFKPGWQVQFTPREEKADRPELAIQAGHRSSEKAVLSPDGRLVLTGGNFDPAAILWDARTGVVLRRLVGTSSATPVGFAEGGRSAIVLEEKAVRVWDVQTGKLVRSLVTDCGPFPVGAVSRDGTLVLVGGDSQKGVTAELWEVATGKQRLALKGKSPIKSLAVSADNRRAAVGYQFEEKTQLVDLQTGEILRTLRPERGAGRPGSTVFDVSFNPDGSHLVAIYTDHRCVVWDTGTGAAVREFKGKNESVFHNNVSYSLDGKYVLSSNGWNSLNEVCLWDAATGKLLRNFVGHTYSVNSSAFSVDGTQVVTAGGGGVFLWDAATGRRVRVFNTAVTPVKSVAVDASGQRVLVAGDGNLLWQLPAGRPAFALQTDPLATFRLAFNPRHPLILVAGEDRTDFGSGVIHLCDAATGKLVKTARWPTGLISGNDNCHADISPDGDTIVTTSVVSGSLARDPKLKKEVVGNLPQIHFWDARTGTLRRMVEQRVPFSIDDLRYSPDGQRLLTLEYPGVAVRDAATGEVRTRFGLADKAMHDVMAFHPGGQLIAVGTREGQILLQDLTKASGTGPKKAGLRELRGHDSFVDTVAFSPDGLHLVSGGWDRTPRLWEVATGRLVRAFTGHEGPVRCATFLPGGRQLLTGSDDGTARLWDVATGEEIVRLLQLNGGKDWLVCTPDGLFDGSAAGRERVNYRVGGGLNVVPVDRFFQDFYRPGLLSSMARGELLKSEVQLGKQTPPNIRIVSPKESGRVATGELVLEVEVTDEGGGVQGPWLFHNGARAAIPGKAERQGKVVRRSFAVTLLTGENRLEVKAASGDGSWEAEPARVVLRYEKPPEKPRLFVLVVGINRYAQSALDLRFAAPDAKAVADLFTRRGKQLYADVHAVALVDQQATRAAILKALEGIAGTAKTPDTLLVFFAGHGTMVGQRYFFVPHDFRRTEGKSQEEDIRAQGLAIDVLGEAVSAVPALKRMLIFDTCQSGGAIAPKRTGRDPFAFRGEIERLSRSQGVFTLAAAAAGEEAQEVPELGHGVLTYSLLAGLRGVKGGPLEKQWVRPSSSDRVADVLEWFSFASGHVPRLTQKYFGREQDVQMSSQGSSFPLLPVEDR